jgi:pyruvate formate lyase activating enzyme
MDRPPTPLSTIRRFLDMANDRISYVYPGNAPQLDNHSYCPECGNLLIERFIYNTELKGIGPDGKCSKCKCEIYGVFKSDLI